MSELYKEIAEKLQALFPEGTVQKTGISNAHIPVQVYMKRLEEVAGDSWSWRIVGNPIYQAEQQAVLVTGELSIMNATRSGFGFSHFQAKQDPKSVTIYKNAVNSAESDALRNACDKFLMGWKDLAPYREWASNPGVFQQKEKKDTPPQSNLEKCTKCKRELTMEDQLFLELHGINIPFCIDDVPNHFKKRIDKT